MDQLWGVLGRAYIDTPFRDELIKSVQADASDPNKPEPDVSKLIKLHDFLAQQGFRTSRYERGEINRIFLICKKKMGEPKLEDNPHQAMVQVSTVAAQILATPGMPPLPSRPAELWSLVGLCAIDSDLRTRYTAVGANLPLELTKAPPFFVSAAEIVFAGRLFTDADMDSGLKDFARNCWIPPKKEETEEILKKLLEVVKVVSANADLLQMVHCGAGYTLNPANRAKKNYQHLDAPLVERLQVALAEKAGKDAARTPRPDRAES